MNWSAALKLIQTQKLASRSGPDDAAEEERMETQRPGEGGQSWLHFQPRSPPLMVTSQV